MYNGGSSKGWSLVNIQMYRDCRKGKLQESKQPPGSSGASVRCSAGLVLQLHAACIYTRELPAKGGRDGARVKGERRAGGSRTGQLAGV